MPAQWDNEKNVQNIQKHGISFEESKEAFFDDNRIITIDLKHSSPKELRYFCFGKSQRGIITVRFTYRKNNIRIIGAGVWREGKKIYEKENNL